jgi:hypothetical protein
MTQHVTADRRYIAPPHEFAIVNGYQMRDRPFDVSPNEDPGLVYGWGFEEGEIPALFNDCRERLIEGADIRLLNLADLDQIAAHC